MKLVLFLFSIVLINYSFLDRSTIKENNNILTKKDSIEKYHFYINKAELNICDSNYLQAIKLYETAFKYHYSPFPNDLYNAALVAIYLQNNNKAIDYCEALVKLGCDLKFFNQIPFNTLKSDKDVWNNFLIDYDSLRNIYYNSINQELKDKIHKLYIEDQKNYCSYKKFGIPMQIPQDLNFKRFKDILKYFGFPNHDIVGLNIKNDTIISLGPQNILLRHYYQKGNYDLSEFLINELFNGKIKPIEFIVVEEFKYKPYSYFGTDLMFKSQENNYYIFDEFKQYLEIKKYNKNRKNFFMETYQDQLKKMIYKYIETGNKTKFVFLIYGISIDVKDDYLIKDDRLRILK